MWNKESACFWLGMFLLAVYASIVLSMIFWFMGCTDECKGAVVPPVLFFPLVPAGVALVVAFPIPADTPRSRSWTLTLLMKAFWIWLVLMTWLVVASALEFARDGDGAAEVLSYLIRAGSLAVAGMGWFPTRMPRN